MKKIEKIRAVLLCVSIFLILAVLGVAFREKKKQIVIKSDKLQRSSSINASIELKNVSYSTINDDNFKEWDIKAGSAKYFKDKERVVLEDLKVNLYRLDGKIYRLEGKHGEFDTKTRNIKMEGRVKGILPDDTEIQTESVFYDHERHIITTEDKILIKRGKSSIEGLGMVIDLKKEKLSILGKVKALGNR